MDNPCMARYTDPGGGTRACTLTDGHMEAHSEGGHFFWAHWASDDQDHCKTVTYHGCEEEVENPDNGGDIWLDCELEIGHTGLHYDGTIDVNWEKP